jgi:Fur family ferric uptake transcriptional regulator
MNQPTNKRKDIRKALDTLKGTGLKCTKPRETLLRFLMANHGPFSAKELHVALKAKGLDAVTTYRCLAAFEKARLVTRCDFGDGIARYEFSEGPEHHHHHVICVDCRKVEKLELCDVVRFENVVKGLGYSKIRHVLEFTGVCRECTKKSA